MDIFEIVEKLEQANWIFAKTMKNMPHEYTLRREWNDDEFVEVVKAIRELGRKEKFFKKEYIYLYANGYKYWTMGCPLHNCNKTGTVLINREKVIYSNDYDMYANKYDELYMDKLSQEQNEKLQKMLVNINGRVLDIGCGTGLGAELFKGRYYQYIGIDGSIMMIEKARKKANENGIPANFINTPIEDFYMRGFDTVMALYGVMSYIPPKEQMKIVNKLQGKKFYLMSYVPGYTPKTETNLQKYSIVVPLPYIQFYNYRIYTNDKELLEEYK